MIGPYQDEEEILQEMLYWQKRALKAEKERDYYKKQFLDKDVETHKILDKFAVELGRRIAAIKYLKGEL